MDLTTTYLGYKLRSPLVASASPLSETVDGIKRLEDAGAGATATMMASALLLHGSKHLHTVEKELLQWMTEFGYESVDQIRGALSQQYAEDPSTYERAQYMKVLTNFGPVLP